MSAAAATAVPIVNSAPVVRLVALGWLLLMTPAAATELPQADTLSTADKSIVHTIQMSQAEYDRFRHQQYMRQKQREFRGHYGRYQQWYEHYKQLEANPALATRRRCPAGYVC